MFYALAIVCDDYFVPSLEKISKVGELIILSAFESIADSCCFGVPPPFILLEPAAERRCCRGDVYGCGKLRSRAFHLAHWLVAQPIRK